MSNVARSIEHHRAGTTAASSNRSGSRKALFAAHLVVAISLIGTDLALLSLGILGAAGAPATAIYPAASQIASWVIGPLVLLVLATGIGQALLSGWGLTRHWWVLIKLSVTVLFTGVIWFVLVPQLAGSARAATAGQAFTTAEMLPLIVVPAFATTVLITLVLIAVYRPWGRRRSSRTEQG